MDEKKKFLCMQPIDTIDGMDYREMLAVSDIITADSLEDAARVVTSARATRPGEEHPPLYIVPCVRIPRTKKTC